MTSEVAFEKLQERCDDRSSYVILNMFFSRFYQQNRGVLDQFPMISGHLYYFLYLSM